MAKENGYKVLRKLTGFHNIFLLQSHPSFGNKRSGLPIKSFENDNRVLWSSKPERLTRTKRDFIPLTELTNLNKLRTQTFFNNFRNDENSFYNNEIEKRKLFNDELWDQEWYLHNTKFDGTRSIQPQMSLNVLPVYEKGITGAGVRVAVIDDGLEYTHEDLFGNYDPEISWDCLNDSPNPCPELSNHLNNHGTRCAGEIAMIANNLKCGVGIAFEVRIGGIKLLGEFVYDFLEAMALGFAYDKIDIYSVSWGPQDDGKKLERPKYLARKAIKRGITHGRNGRGVIYVWATGNGRGVDDNCSCDGYVSSIYTIGIGSASQHGTLPWYSEICSATLAVTYSSGLSTDLMITTTDFGNTCTLNHTGTSASAPLAAGIIALGLQANPSLTWRDVQHIIVNSAEYIPLITNSGWIKNGAGFYYNMKFGYGLMNGEGFVKVASSWSEVGPQKVDKIFSKDVPIEMDLNKSNVAITFFYDLNEIQYLEHVQVNIKMECQIRGMIEIFLTSPYGTKVQMLATRENDDSSECFQDWTFTSVATWSENPTGIWILNIINNCKKTLENSIDLTGYVKNSTLILYGTKEKPEILKLGFRRYE